MKLVVISDIHLGRYKYGKINTSTGIDTRTEDILHNIDSVIKFCEQNGVQVIVIAGDCYHLKKPDQTFRKLLTQKIEKFLSDNIKVFVLLGNHDQGRTRGHDLVELLEISNQVKDLHIIEEPETYAIDNTALYFLPHVNPIDKNIPREKFYDYQIDTIKRFTRQALKSKIDYKLFFAHFGTDKSKIGNSFDFGSSKSSKSAIPLSIFDSDAWTKVYLGDIHKHQEMNKFCRHVGSIAKVDFGEEGEEKGFYFFDNGKDKFIKLEDREFKTFKEDLVVTGRNTLDKIIDDINSSNISESITRFELRVKETDRKTLDISSVEKLLKKKSWNYIGKNIVEVAENTEDIDIKEIVELNYVTIFKEFVEKNRKIIGKDIFNSVLSEGEKILLEISNEES